MTLRRRPTVADLRAAKGHGQKTMLRQVVTMNPGACETFLNGTGG